MRSFLHLTLVSSIAMFALPAHAQLLTGYEDQSAPEPVVTVQEGEKKDIELYIETPAQSPEGERSFNIASADPAITQKSSVYAPLMTRSNEGLGGVSDGGDEKDAPVDITAGEMTHDENANIVSAHEDVFIVQSGRILRADDVAYNLSNDTVNARGNVVLNETTGDIHLADYAEYNNRLRDGRVENLRTYLNDGSRFTAEEGTHAGGVKTTMEDASYTPCKLCENDPDDEPTWAIKASEVTHDKDEHRVSYKNARFEAMGVPILYTPYFSHPDGTIKQKSGFLSPKFGFKSELGAFAESRYYWAIDPHQDATFGVMAMTEQLPLGLAEYRRRWEDAYLQLSGAVTASDRTDRTSGVDVKENDELRGHVFAEGLWNMNEKWRSGVNINWTSDDQYMRQYDFTNEDVLENEIYAERFSGRNYASGRLIAYQDIRLRDVALDQPDVLPEIVASFKGEPGAVPLVKGQWTVDASALGLRRDSSEQDMQRFSVGAGWNRELVSDYGFLTSVDADVRGDVYYATDRLVATPGSGRSTSSTDTRVFPRLNVQTSYPMAREFESMQARIEPIVALTLAPNLTNQTDIPNEDSNDVQIDSSNIFEPNRFPGLDRVEDHSRITYGGRAGLFAYDGSHGDVFLGQSYRFTEDDNPFPEGSGLDRQESDIVGQLSGNYKNLYSLDYRFQLSSDDFSSERHEVDASADWNRLRVQSTYLYAEGLEGTDIDESREQLRADAQLYLTEEWRTRFGATQDMGDDPGLRKAYAGLDYLGQCLFWSLTGERNYTRDASGESDTEILFRVGLKNLGEFEESSLRPAVETQ